MSAIAFIVVSLVALVLVSLGIVIGWVIGTNDLEIDILAKRLAAEQRIAASTRATLAAIREAARQRGF